MAEQGTRERDEAASGEDTSSGAQESGAQERPQQESSDGESSDGSSDGKSSDGSSEAETSDAGTSDAKTSDGSSDAETSDAETSDAKTSDGSSEAETSDAKSADGSSDAKTSDGKSPDGGPPARRSENHAKPEQLSDEDREAQERNRSSFLRRKSSSDGEDAPRRPSIDLSEILWKGSGILATVVRVVTLVFAAILVANVGLTIVGVNPDNGVARFVRGFADTVVLGFRDLFLPADPTIMLAVNYGVAAVFWVVLGVFLAAGLRWVAARLA